VPRPFRNHLGQIFRPVPGATTQMAIWPVRVRDFAAFVAATRYPAEGGMLTLGPDDHDWLPKGGTWQNPGFPQTPNDPVVGVNLPDAEAFCRWLTRQERTDGRIQAPWRYRVPTDREWSAAIGLERESGGTPEARAADSDGRYPWGPDWPPPRRFGNYAGAESCAGMPSWWGVVPGGYRDPYPRTSPVGSFRPNAHGFFDLSGNVWEWCSDAYSGGLARVTRGGSWGSDRPAYLRSAQRNPQLPRTRNDELGFRIVLARR
jgi:eukaryotic-like serine/threonine-protein kinase